MKGESGITKTSALKSYLLEFYICINIHKCASSLISMCFGDVYNDDGVSGFG